MARSGEKRNTRMVVVLKPEEQIPFGRHRIRWDDNIEVDQQDRIERINWFVVGPDRNKWVALMNFHVA